MKNVNPDDGVRTRLILSALEELLEHGVADFSLRRVALSAQVSCAAPYRHFKSKEELIAETAKYITSKWQLLCKEIISVYGDDIRRTLIELSVNAFRFWVANGNFRSVLIPEADSPLHDGMKDFDRPIIEYAGRLSDLLGISPEEKAQKSHALLALIYGNVVLAGAGKLLVNQASSILHLQIEALFSV